MRSVPASLLECARRQAGLVTLAQAVAHGLSPSTVYRLASSGRWRAILPGVFEVAAAPRAGRGAPAPATAPAEDPAEVRLLARAARLKWGDDVVVSGRSAAVLLGYPLPPTPRAWLAEYGLPPDPPVSRLTVTAPPGRGFGAPGVVVHRRQLEPGDTVRTAEARLTSPVRTAADLLRAEPLLTAVAATDAAVRSSRGGLRMVAADLVDNAWLPGAAQGRRRVGLADPRCESPLETMLRVLLALAGLPRPVSQFEVRDGTDHWVARVDFAYPDAGLVLECDGRTHHQTWSAGVRDRRRQNRLVVEAGLRVLRFTHDDLALRPDVVATEVRAALRA